MSISSRAIPVDPSTRAISHASIAATDPAPAKGSIVGTLRGAEDAQPPLSHHVGTPCQNQIPTRTALDLPARGLRQSASLQQHDRINLEVVLFCHGLADGCSQLAHVHIASVPLDLLGHHEPLRPVYLDRE